MRVIDYINIADPAAVRAEYAARYPHDSEITTPAWEQFKAAVNARVLVERPDMQVVLRYRPACDGENEYIDVSGRDAGGTTWALDFTPWSDWKGMTVIDQSGLGLTSDQIAAHLFYEMTWHGAEQAMEQVRDEVFDAAEQVRRMPLGHE